MYLWKVDSLADDFRKDKVSEYEGLKYLLVLTILLSVTFIYPYRDQSAISFDQLPVGYFVPILWLASGLIGLLLCFKANQRGDGKDFIRRFVCLSVPAMVRTTVLWILPLVILAAAVGRLAFPKSQVHAVALIETWIIIEILIVVSYFTIYTRLRAISAQEVGSQRAGA